MATLRHNHPREHPTTLRKLLASPSLSRPKDWWRAQCAWHDVSAPERGTIKTLREALENAMRAKEGAVGGGSVLKGVVGGRVTKRGREKEKEKVGERGKVEEAEEKENSTRVKAKAKGKEKEEKAPEKKNKKRAGRTSCTPRTPKTVVPPKTPADGRSSSKRAPRVPERNEEAKLVKAKVDRETAAEGQENDALEPDTEAMDFEMEYETEYREQMGKLNGEGSVDENVRRRRESLFWGVPNT